LDGDDETVGVGVSTIQEGKLVRPVIISTRARKTVFVTYQGTADASLRSSLQEI